MVLIMDDIGAFMRVDTGKEQEFENVGSAYYQWVFIPEYEEEFENGNEEEYEEDTAMAAIIACSNSTDRPILTLRKSRAKRARPTTPWSIRH